MYCIMQDWSYLRGGLTTIDRDYGMFNKIHHDIGTHVLHHLFPQVGAPPALLLSFCGLLCCCSALGTAFVPQGPRGPSPICCPMCKRSLLQHHQWFITMLCG